MSEQGAKGPGKGGAGTRTRRSPEAAREQVLSVAASRLAAQGLDGLNIKDVAREADMSHGTLLHHFGSAAGMQRALVRTMDLKLLTDVVQVLRQQAGQDEPVGLCRHLFDVLSRDGHAKLHAWRAVTDQSLEASEDATRLFDEVASALSQRLRGGESAEDLTEVRYLVMLVVTSALGYALLPGFADTLGLDAEQAGAFPDWLVALIADHEGGGVQA